eukprot:m.113136 g.113136  ORF g.113136 m.113136 type:complete len:129 (+) comp12797_c0_seq1:66-452(+)
MYVLYLLPFMVYFFVCSFFKKDTLTSGVDVLSASLYRHVPQIDPVCRARLHNDPISDIQVRMEGIYTIDTQYVINLWLRPQQKKRQNPTLVTTATSSTSYNNENNDENEDEDDDCETADGLDGFVTCV